MSLSTPALRVVPVPAPSGLQNAIDAVNTLTLVQRAQRNWPGNTNYQSQWIRCVRRLRAGKGWVLEGAKVDWHANAQ